MKRFIDIITIVSLIIFSACNEEELMDYEGGGGIYFIRQQQSLTFINKMDAEKDTMKVYVHLMGNPVDYDRIISFEVINDENTTAGAEHYKVLESKVAANDTCGYIFIEVNNPEYLNVNDKTLRLHIALKENEQLKTGGFLDYLEINLSWTTDVVQPQTWNAMRYFFCSVYSSNVYRAIIESTGILELWYFSADPETGAAHDEVQSRTLGRIFGDWVREYNATHDDVYRHDDGNNAGEEIVPLY